jgi:hypothetical protein
VEATAGAAVCCARHAIYLAEGHCKSNHSSQPPGTREISTQMVARQPDRLSVIVASGIMLARTASFGE